MWMLPASSRNILFHPKRASGLIRQPVSLALLYISVVPLDPRPSDVKPGIQRDQFRPQLAVLQLVPASISPALSLPVGDEDSHSINQVFRVGMQFDACPGWD